MRYLFVLLLTACAATEWQKDGATRADLDRDYRECNKRISELGPSAAGAVAFGALGAAAGISAKDEKIRECLRSRGWQASQQ